jgi:hypothetical protein
VNADVRQVLLGRAEAAHRYATHLLSLPRRAPASWPRSIGLMAVEHLQIAARALVALHAKGLA